MRSQPPIIEPESVLYGAATALVPGSRVLHLLAQTLEQREDIYIVLADDSHVVRFEMQRPPAVQTPFEVAIWMVEDYRREIGQGRLCDQLDLALEQARDHLTQARAL